MSNEPLVQFDARKANIARAYDYILGGKDNYAVDRELAAKMLEVYPLAVLCCGLLGGVAGHAQLADVPEQGEAVPGGHVEAVGVCPLLFQFSQPGS
jgi:hypothetical protein